VQRKILFFLILYTIKDMSVLESDLRSRTIKELKEIIKVNKKYFSKESLKGFSKLKKNELINLLQTLYSVRKIQKILRQHWTYEKPICPLSLEPVIYPLFAFKPKGSRKFIYYNLEVLSSYLLTSGDFKDPSTRESYSESSLKSIDKELLRNGIKINGSLKSIYQASKNKKYYKNKKEMEDNILVLDRCLDEIISSLRYWIENKKTNIEINILYMAFRSYFKRLCVYSSEQASSLIKRTIISINNCIKNENDHIASNYRDNVILFLCQIQYDELGI
jgi:hypothetical protein